MVKRDDSMSKPEWQDREYREAYLEASLEQGIAWQIRINRQKRGITQEDLAKAMGISLPMMQELEDPEIGEYPLETLVKVAKVFDCALSVKFIPYSELAEDSQNLSEDAQYAPPYTAASSVKKKSLRGFAMQSEGLLFNFSLRPLSKGH
jgi:transcriptional regulator with XRE-family HTH domain